MEKKTAAATLDREQDALELFATQHQPPFETIAHSSNGGILFCYPIPGVEYADRYDVNELEEAWTKYADEHFPAWLAEHPECETTHRTRKASGDVFPVAKFAAQITHPAYDGALKTKQAEGKNAFLQPTTSKDIHIERDMLYIDGQQQPSNAALLSQFYLRDLSGRMTQLDLPMLNVLFATLKNAIDAEPETFITDKRRAIYSEGVLRIYVPELIKALGINGHYSQAQYEAFVDRIALYNSVLGIIKTETTEMTYPLMSMMTYNAKDNTISLTSPYMVAIYEILAVPRLKLDKNGKPVRNKHREEIEIDNYAYLIKSELFGQKSERAIAVVEEIVYLIVRAGGNLAPGEEVKVPHIKVRKLLENIPELDELVLDKNIPAKKASDIIAQTFKTAWVYIEKYTILREKYREIQIPTDFIPRMKTLDKNLEFPHKGLISNHQEV